MRSCLHSEVATQSGEESTGQEGHWHKWILHTKERQHREYHEQKHKHNGHDLVLTEQIRHRALTDISCDLLHAVIARIGLFH